MSRENVEIVRGFVEEYLRGGWPESAWQLAADAEMHGTIGGLTEGGIWRGPEQIREALEHEDSEAWDERRLEAEEYIDAGEGVIVLFHEFRRGRRSGVETHVDSAVVYELRDDRVVRIQGYMDRAEALDAAGLSE